MLFSYLSAPTKVITEMMADQVAPSYWIPNKDVIVSLKQTNHDVHAGFFFRFVHRVNFSSALNIRNIIVEVKRDDHLVVMNILFRSY